jgi:ubiquinone/menaquinone biosynthesis C-methylase UbiE
MMYGDAVSDHQQDIGDAHLDATRQYYDEFSRRYDDRRGGKVRGGYHDLLDDLELGFLSRFATGARVLEVGCGTGLLLERMAEFALETKGVDLSAGMLRHALARGLDAVEGSATELPFGDESFDVACSFKVLAHVKEIERALAEMVRVIRPGGTVIAEFYNPYSLRALVKRFGPAGAISSTTNENAVYTRFDSPADVKRLLPAGTRVVDHRGVRIVTPYAPALELPLLGPILNKLERTLCDGPLASFGGFWIAAIRKDD